MKTYLDIHEHVEGLTAEAVAGAHQGGVVDAPEMARAWRRTDYHIIQSVSAKQRPRRA